MLFGFANFVTSSCELDAAAVVLVADPTGSRLWYDFVLGTISSSFKPCLFPGSSVSLPFTDLRCCFHGYVSSCLAVRICSSVGPLLKYGLLEDAVDFCVSLEADMADDL